MDVGNAHICPMNFMIVAADVCAVVSEGGILVAMAVLGLVVTMHVTSNAVYVGDETAVVSMSHGGIHNSPSVIPLNPGTKIIPTDFEDMVNPEVVTMEKMKVTPTELTGNLSINSTDTEKAVETVYKYGTTPTADNMPGMFHSTCLPEPGVDAAAYLVIKPSGGYGIITGGATAELGKPDPVVSGRHFGPIILDVYHNGPAHMDSGLGVPMIKTCA